MRFHFCNSLFVFCLYLFCLNKNIEAQTLDSLLFIPGHITNFDVDRAGNIFTASGNKISLFDAKSNLKATMVFQAWSAVDAIDAADFHQILCYNKDLAQVYFVDNKLNNSGGAINLADAGLFDLGGVGASKQTSLIVYNNQTQKIESYDAQMTKVWETMSIQTYAELDEKQISLKASPNYLILKPNSRCVLVFNPQGGFIQRIDVKEVKSIYVDGSNLVYTDGSAVFIQRIESQQIEIFNERKFNKKITGIALKDNRVYLLFEEGIRAFSILNLKE